jgi:hypothetical protein
MSRQSTQSTHNKMSDREEHRAERIKEKLKDQNVGEDDAAEIASRQAIEEEQSGHGGGGNAGGEAKKGAEKRR